MDNESKLTASKPRIQADGKLVPLGNGGVGRNGMYSWTQTLNDLTVYVEVPMNTRGKDVTCVIKTQSISTIVTGVEDNLLHGQFEEAVQTDESIWTLASDKSCTQIVISQ